MLQAIDRAEVAAALERFANRAVYVHHEAIPGGFVRNVQVQVRRAMIRGDGPYRVALDCGGAWLQAENLTDYEVDAAGRLLLAGVGADGRLTGAFHLSLTPFPQ